VGDVVEAAANDVDETLSLGSYGYDNDDSANFGMAATTTIVQNGRTFTVDARRLDAILDESSISRVGTTSNGGRRHPRDGRMTWKR
jgi:hypothetical protein